MEWDVAGHISVHSAYYLTLLLHYKALHTFISYWRKHRDCNHRNCCHCSAYVVWICKIKWMILYLPCNWTQNDTIQFITRIPRVFATIQYFVGICRLVALSDVSGFTPQTTTNVLLFLRVYGRTRSYFLIVNIFVWGLIHENMAFISKRSPEASRKP